MADSDNLDSVETSSRIVDRSRINAITGDIVNAAFQLHSRVGPGLLESFYETVLTRELVRRGYWVERQKPVSFDYDGLWFDNVGRADLVVERIVIVEVKSVAAIAWAHEKQLMTYQRLLDCRVGLLLNFGAPLMKDGIKRLAHRL